MHRYLLFAVTAIYAASCAVIPVSPARADEVQCPTPVEAEAPVGPPLADLLTSHRVATGDGVKVAVIDTGVAAHPRLGTVVPGADLIKDEPRGALEDCDGHGTIVAGIIAARPDPKFQDSIIGIAPDANIIAIRQSSSILRRPESDSSGTIASLADAIHRAVDLKAQVINVSLASCVPSSARKLDTRVLDEALGRAESSGAVVVAAAGNLGNTCDQESVSYPAAAKTVLAVAATEHTHSLADYSMFGPLSAPGTVPVALSPRGNGFASAMVSDQAAHPFTGTSFAAPVVSGMVAQLRQRYPGDSPAQLREKIRAAAVPGTGHLAPGVALMQLEPAASQRTPPITAPRVASTKIQLRSYKVLLLALGTLSLTALAVAAMRMRN